MCQVFSRISKLCARRASSCFFSSVPQSPYLMVSGGFGGSVDTAEGRIVKPRFLDPTKKETIVCGGEMMIPNECPWFCVGASQGWIMRRYRRNFHLTEAYNPWVLSPRVVSLPDTPVPMPKNEIMSLSSSDAGRPITIEEHWAEKLLSALESFSTFKSVNEARELMMIGYIHGQWVCAKIDRIQFNDMCSKLILIDLKTRGSNNLPSRTQQNKDKFQVMLYMHLFDSLINQEDFPLEYFFAHYSLNRMRLLSTKVTERVEGLGHIANTLDDLVCLYNREFRKLKHLIGNVDVTFRIEYQSSYKCRSAYRNTTVSTVDFGYDPKLTLENFRTCMDVWNCEQNADFTIEKFKCDYCPYGDSCPESSKVDIE